MIFDESPAVPKLARADAMHFPFREFVREFHESRPQLSYAFDIQISPDVKNFPGRPCRFALLVDGLKKPGVSAIEAGGEELSLESKLFCERFLRRTRDPGSVEHPSNVQWSC